MTIGKRGIRRRSARNLSSRRPLIAGLLAIVALLLGASSASAGVANAGLPTASPTNPLAGVYWGPYFPIERRDPSFDPPSYFYANSGGADHAAFGSILAQPRFRWFGDWYPTYDQKWGARTAVTQYIQEVTRGNPNVGVQLGVFRLKPFENCGLTPTDQEAQDYRDWIDQFAQGIGNTRAVVELQPDNIFTLCATRKGRATFFGLLRYAVKVLNALPYTTVYLDAGAADWLGQKDGSQVHPADVARMLVASGIAEARGFILNVTHYDYTGNEEFFGTVLLGLLRRMGVPGKHFIVNTAQNGHPFTTQAHPRAFHRGTVCATPSSRFCVALGQPPTTDTGNPNIDGLLWVGRPWVNNDVRRGYSDILHLVTTSPFLSELPTLDTRLLTGLPVIP